LGAALRAAPHLFTRNPNCNEYPALLNASIAQNTLQMAIVHDELSVYKIDLADRGAQSVCRYQGFGEIECRDSMNH